ncbi:MAG: hypothetical protein D6160_02000 [Ketobacter sp.]|nr:MAG: hypothetical protein D6160_02000 [Ketobacter sp.]
MNQDGVNCMTTTLLADIGGTKTQLALADENAHISQPFYALNKEHTQFESLLTQYLQDKPKPVNAVIAVAGPVDGNIRCQMTNLSWLIDGIRLKQQFGFSKVVVMNDLQATSWGLTSTTEQAALRLLPSGGEPAPQLNFNLPVVVISPGTGLGQSCIYPHEGDYVIAATEGGHKTIAPFDNLSAQLIANQWRQSSRPVSWENWFSGSGIANLYSAMYPGQTVPDNEEIGRRANQDPSSDCGKVMDVFAKAVYAEAGNLVLQYLGWGGVIVAGGIPAKLQNLFSKPENIQYLSSKNEYLDRLRSVPVALCLEQNIPIRGAAVYSRRLLKSEPT